MRIIPGILTFFALSLMLCLGSNAQDRYVKAIMPAPVLNTVDFRSVFGGESGTEVKRDNQGLIRELEFIALPNTLFKINAEYTDGETLIYEVTTKDYPYTSTQLFIDSRFVMDAENASDRSEALPTKEEIISRMEKVDGYQYMWGGNFADGIKQLVEYYAPSSEISAPLKSQWCLEGVDCSGLLYQATNGNTPRNTSSLVYYGEAVDVEAKTPEEIAASLEPLDLIVWKGHVIIVIDKNTVIESSNPEGVHKTNLIDRLYSVMNDRTGVNDYDSYNGKRFVIRRWHNN